MSAAALQGLDCDVLVLEPTRALSPGFDCSILEAQKLAWFLRGAVQRLGLPNPMAGDFVAGRYGPYSEQVRHLLNSLDGSDLACERRVTDARPFEPIRFRYDRQAHIRVYLTAPETRDYRPALAAACEIIDGYQSPHGMELLATLDWLHQQNGVALDAAAMMPAITTWPGPPGSAARKARSFTRQHVEIAVAHLRTIAATTAAQPTA